jgi:uncharacterized protein (TIGR04255 family)
MSRFSKVCYCGNLKQFGRLSETNVHGYQCQNGSPTLTTAMNGAAPEFPLPSFKKPPVIEVVSGITFKSLDSVLTPHIGLLWHEFQSEYPICQEAEPLVPVIEKFGEKTIGPTSITFSNLPRIWFLSKERNELIQFQRDRFLFNWRKVRNEDEYPRYGSVKTKFQQHWKTFEAFVEKQELGELAVQQLELTYVNHVPLNECFTSYTEIARVFPDFCWRNSTRFLPSPEQFNFQTSFALPEQIGRLHITVKSAHRKSTQLPVMVFDLTVRGLPKEGFKENMWVWFDTAREWIVKGFVDLTASDFQNNVWQRTT